jgi:hypothetical protein
MGIPHPWNTGTPRVSPALLLLSQFLAVKLLGRDFGEELTDKKLVNFEIRDLIPLAVVGHFDLEKLKI